MFLRKARRVNLDSSDDLSFWLWKCGLRCFCVQRCNIRCNVLQLSWLILLMAQLTKAYTNVDSISISAFQTSVQVPSPAHGVIEALLVPDGGKVEGGTPLFTLRKTGGKEVLPVVKVSSVFPCAWGWVYYGGSSVRPHTGILCTLSERWKKSVCCMVNFVTF